MKENKNKNIIECRMNITNKNTIHENITVSITLYAFLMKINIYINNKYLLYKITICSFICYIILWVYSTQYEWMSKTKCVVSLYTSNYNETKMM